MPASSTLDAAFLARLDALLGPGGLARGDALAGAHPGYHPDNLAAGVQASPRTVDEASAVLALCHEAGISVVPHGGRTGLVGGGASRPGQIVLSTRRLDRVVEIDTAGRLAVVEAGVTLQQLQGAAAEHGLTPGIDLAARGSATIGGMIATNAGGIEAFRRGTMRHRVLGLEFLRADGTVVSDLVRVLKNNTGYDLKDLIAGSEGTLGIVTRAVVRLERQVAPAATALVACASAEAALAAALRLRDRFPGRLRALEIMWHAYAETVAQEHGVALSGFGLDPAPVYLLTEAEQDPDTDIAAAMEAEIGALWQEGAVAGAALAQNERQRELFWRIRDDSDAIGRACPGVKTFDVSVPLSGLPAYVERIRAELAATFSPAMRVYVFGHLADGNLHVLVGDWPEGSEARIEAILYDGLAESGGSFSAEHGIGLEKQDAFRRYADPARRAAMAAVKAALDPKGILNPGKILA
ncbi:FAD-binding oxidoreductase [Inquilinus sp. NPDC058860]|uniref:FAD-binding oxidoreductase n=1 Tax=Inquilinus sp. NPDC058860 TaxID=3346652 RepID=UPI0036A90ED4